MKHVLTAFGDQRFAWKEEATSKPESGQVRVISEFSAAKHGTEVAIFQGYYRRRGSWNYELDLQNYDATGDEASESLLGNAAVGTIAEVGDDVVGYRVGDRVLVYEVPFSEEHVVNTSKCFVIPRDLAWQSAVCMDPAVFALGAIRDGNVRVGDRVAVFGCGAIGLMAVQLAKCAGAATVVAVDPIPQRRGVALELGADAALDPTACDSGREATLACGGHGADVSIEFSGNVNGLQAAIRALAFGGTVVYGAYPKPFPAGLDLGAEAHVNTPNIVFSRSCSSPNRDHPRWDLSRIFDCSLQMLIDGNITGVPVVGPIVDFEELPEIYPTVVLNPEAGIKLGACHGR